MKDLTGIKFSKLTPDTCADWSETMNDEYQERGVIKCLAIIALGILVWLLNWWDGEE